jgi:hypothetical protein
MATIHKYDGRRNDHFDFGSGNIAPGGGFGEKPAVK